MFVVFFGEFFIVIVQFDSENMSVIQLNMSKMFQFKSNLIWNEWSRFKLIMWWFGLIFLLCDCIRSVDVRFIIRMIIVVILSVQLSFMVFSIFVVVKQIIRLLMLELVEQILFVRFSFFLNYCGIMVVVGIYISLMLVLMQRFWFRQRC